MGYQTGHVMTLANSIIGVSVLAMPYCFKQCGIVLSILMLLVSSIISRLACHFLMKSAIIARRKTFEFLAYYIFGAMGKFAIEIGIIGFLIGTCIAFFVVMGDLGPEIISEITGSYTTNTMRTSILMALALFCVLPLGLLRNIDSLNGVSKATIGFYCCLVLKIVFEGIPHIFAGDWHHSVNFWRPEGILQCLPIFTMALFCQTQLFEIYQALHNATLEQMNNLVRVAVNICTCVYIFVGIFGYIAFFQKPFTGNILLSFSPSLMTDIMKIGFILSVAFSFPLVIFPCRASLYSLLYKEGYPLHEGVSTYIPEGRFKSLTLFIVFISLIIGIMIPNIELVLGLVGSTIGVMICVLFPVACFICISPKNTNERILAQLMLMIGVFVMVLGTYKNLYSLDNLEPNTVTISSFKNFEQLDSNLDAVPVPDKLDMEKRNVLEKIITTVKALNVEPKANIVEVVTTAKPLVNEELKEIRHEPPQPVEPVEEEVKNVDKGETPNVDVQPPVKEKVEDIPPQLIDISNKVVNNSKNDEVDIEAIKKEEKEVEQQEKDKIKEGNANQVLIDSIQKQNEAQQEMVEQQKKINEQKVIAMKNIENIAKQAIEKISGGENDANIVANLKQQIDENVNNEVKKNQNANEVNAIIKDSNNEMAKTKKVDTVNVSNEEKREPLVLVPDVNDKGQENIVVQNVAQNEGDGAKTKNKIYKKVEVSESKIEEDINKENNAAVRPDPVIKKEENVIKPNKVEENVLPEKNEQVIEQNKVPSSKINATNNLTNTAPLFLKLGKPDGRLDENSAPQVVPIPLVIAGNSVNLSKPETAPAVSNSVLQPEVKNAQIDSKEELQILRRDILSIKSKR